MTGLPTRRLGQGSQTDKQTMNFQRATSFDEWVWVKDKAFTVSETEEVSHFLVQWNNVDCMFAVTSRCRSRVAQDETDHSNTDSFSIPAIFSIHNTLLGINSDIPRLPKALPKEPRGLKAILVGMQIPSNMDPLCKDLENYFIKTSQVVGSTILHQVSFSNLEIIFPIVNLSSESRALVSIISVIKLIKTCHIYLAKKVLVYRFHSSPT